MRQEIPEPLRTELRVAYEGQRAGVHGSTPLHTLLLSARNAGWTLQALGEACGVTREAVRQWLLVAELHTDLPVVDVPEPEHYVTLEEERLNRSVNAELEQVELLEHYLPLLRAVKGDAESLRGPSASNPKKAAASVEYTRLLNEALEMGLRPSRLAKELDIQIVTIYARLRRGGYRPLAPSEKSRLTGWKPPRVDLRLVG